MPPLNKTQFLTVLSSVANTTFPSLNNTATITGAGLNSKNGFRYRRKNGEGSLITLPFNPIYDTYLHFYGCKVITTKMVRIQLASYGSYDSFWMALMLAMKLGTRNATNPNAIDM